MKRIVVCFCLAIATSVFADDIASRDTSADFDHETPVQKLPTPVDFNKLEYAEADHSVDMSFWELFKDGEIRHISHVGAALEDVKAFYKIECDFEKHTAVVTRRLSGKPLPDLPDLAADMKEFVEIFTILPPNRLRDLCLLHVDKGGVHVISMQPEIGSFIDTVCNLPDPSFLIHEYNNTEIRYGTCRN